MATKEGTISIVKVLLDGGADASIKNEVSDIISILYSI